MRPKSKKHLEILHHKEHRNYRKKQEDLVYSSSFVLFVRLTRKKKINITLQRKNSTKNVLIVKNSHTFVQINKKNIYTLFVEITLVKLSLS